MKKSKRDEMNIKKALESEHSKVQTTKIANYIGTSASRMKGLMHLYFSADKIHSQRAAWVMSVVAVDRPGLLVPYLEKIITHLDHAGLHDAIKRNGVKVLEMVDIPYALYGPVATLCFKLVANPGEAVATRCYALSVLARICLREPGLKNELKLIMETTLPYATAGFRSRIKRALAEIG